MNDQDETLQIFFQETEDLLKAAEEALLSLEQEPRPGPDVEELFRSVHTLKSGAAMVGFARTSEYAHLLENLLERVRNGTLTITKPLISFLLDDMDFLKGMLENAAAGEQEADPGVLKTKKAQINRYLGMDAIPGVEEPEPPPRAKPAPEPEPEHAAVEKAPAQAPSEEPSRQPAKAGKEEAPEAEDLHYYEILLRFRDDLFLSGQDPILLLLALSEMAELEDVVPELGNLPRYEDLDPYKMYMGWRIIAATRASMEEIEDIFMFVKDDNDIHVTDVTQRYKEGVDVEVGELPLGEVLVERGAISKMDLDEALGRQKRLGEILVETGKIDEATLTQVVSQQTESRTTYRKTSLRVDVEKIDHLVNLAEEIGISLSRMQNMVGGAEHPLGTEIEVELEQMAKVNREFQERVAQVRMFPLEGTFRRFQRIARDTAFEQGKKIRVYLQGVDTELDKEVIEHITDPLKHLVRNSIDHGIETPEEREAAGKDPEGYIEFRAFQKGGMILVQISDDGRGIDCERVMREGVDKGVVRPGELVDQTNVLDIICRPGFSTAAEITSISGRGVGMDVVKTEVERLGGSMVVETKKGEGTTFTLALPLTFALTEALHILDHGRSYLIPLWGVAGTEEFLPEKARSFGANQRVYMFRDEYIPVVDLARVYGVGDDPVTEPGKVLVFIDTARQRFGMLVDEVRDPHQVVVKSLETNYKGVAGISGATIMGDGSVALVVDLFSLEEIFFAAGRISA
ncbi:MAG: chemotaxis protein CheW [Desulfatibacillaceae bacterium]